MDSLKRNIRLAIRTLRRSPGFTVAATLSLALGIGLSTAVFTVADALLLRRLPVRDQDRLVVVAGEIPGERAGRYPFGYDQAREFSKQTATMQSVAYFADYGSSSKPILDGDGISRLRRALVSGNFFDVVGATPVVGRALRVDDDLTGAAPVVVLSYTAWQRRFGADRNVVGRRIATYDDSITYTVVGVMAQGLDFPRGTDFWAPIASSTATQGLQYVSVNLVGRLAPHVTPSRAADELTAVFRRPDTPSWQHRLRGAVTPLPRVILGDTRIAIVVFAVAAGLLLLITCTNVASLLLVRGFGRGREVAVRTALGAHRSQIVMQFLTESALLAVAGAVLGIAFAAAAVRGFVVLAPAGVPRLDEIGINMTALVAALGITATAVALFAIAPAFITSRVDPQRALRSGTRNTASRPMRLAMEGLVVGQLALSLLVLSAASLIGRSFIKLGQAELGFEPSHILIAELTLRTNEYGDAAKQVALVERLLTQIAAMPGVIAVSPTVAPPFSGNAGWDGAPSTDAQTSDEAAANPMLNMEVVAPSYFTTFNIPVLRGRAFTDADRAGAVPVTIISQSAAQHYWPNRNPIGKRLRMGRNKDDLALTVVGIVANTRYRELREARATIYFPLRQSFFPFAPTTLAIRTATDPAAFAAALRRTVSSAAPGVDVASATPFAAFLGTPLAQPRLNALLLALFAATSVALAAVGLFGVLATLVRQRTNEFGVRMALGATASDLRRMVMRRGFLIGVLGSAAGLAATLFTNRLLGALLYGVGPTDVLTSICVTILLIVVSVAASLIPAHWSARTDPVAALRAEV